MAVTRKTLFPLLIVMVMVLITNAVPESGNASLEKVRGVCAYTCQEAMGCANLPTWYERVACNTACDAICDLDSKDSFVKERLLRMRKKTVDQLENNNNGGRRTALANSNGDESESSTRETPEKLDGVCAYTCQEAMGCANLPTWYERVACNAGCDAICDLDSKDSFEEERLLKTRRLMMMGRHLKNNKNAVVKTILANSNGGGRD